MKSRQPIGDEEINRYMNFDDLLTQRNAVIEKRKKVWLRLAIVGALITISAVVGLYYASVPEKTSTNTTLLEENKTVESKNGSFKNDTIAAGPKPLAIEKPLQTKATAHSSSKSAVSQETHDKNNPEQTQAKSQPENVYIQAEPVDGYQQLYAWFEKSLVYPKEAVKDSIQGVVTVVFSIDENGKAQNIHIDNSLGKVFDDEVYRLMANMPLWKPATYNGHYVQGKISLPLTFQIKKLNSKK